MGRFILVSLGWLILAVSLSGAGAQRPCPGDWFTYTDNCYKVFTAPKTWNDAQVFCIKQMQSCSLATIHDAKEAAAVASYLTTEHIEVNVWIGAWDPFKQGIWQWSDCSKNNYTAWKVGEPNNTTGNNFCTALSASSNFNSWISVDCDTLTDFICEFKTLHQDEGTTPPSLEKDI